MIERAHQVRRQYARFEQEHYGKTWSREEITLESVLEIKNSIEWESSL